MQYNTHSKVEAYFSERDFLNEDNVRFRKVPLIATDNYVELGQLTALRFLEWVALNPGGVVALPTGRTPEFFIQWVSFYLKNWKKEIKSGMPARIGLDPQLQPDIGSLYFFQLDEFFPINPLHERSFNYFVKKYYIDGLGFDPNKANLIDTFNFTAEQKCLLDNAENVTEIFPDGVIDLSLRISHPKTESEKRKQKAIKLFDQFCSDYEDKIRHLGGIGFFLGGIGPDGHIAFNVKGSSHHSHTRLTQINYETQAAAATDLGGIEEVRKKAVITMGLETITFNPEAVAIIIAAGESKSAVVKDATESSPELTFPATSLQKLSNARFYVSHSATTKLTKSKSVYKRIQKSQKSNNLIENLIICDALDHKISLMELKRKHDKTPKLFTKLDVLKSLSGTPVNKHIDSTHQSIVEKIERGLKIPTNQIFMHTAPHHDDIELAYFPYLHHLVRSVTNHNHFVYCTSGFTAVTNRYVTDCLHEAQDCLNNPVLTEKLKSNHLTDLSEAQMDITGFLNGIASQNIEKQKFYLSSRLLRRLMADQALENTASVAMIVERLIQDFNSMEPGRKTSDISKKIKGWLREFEAELVWAHFGIEMDHVDHLNLGFYSDDIFPQYPNYESDIKPILELMEKIKPTVVTLALDPEGSGPDTHYKTLIALGEAIDTYVKNHPDINLRIWGYRNVWSKFDLSDVNMVVPVSLNSFAVLHNMFNSCFISQKSASFPSYELEGTFSELAQKIWVEQHNQLTTLLGKEYFYDNPNPLLKRAYGAIYIKDMNYQEFQQRMISVKRLLDAKKQLEG